MGIDLDAGRNVSDAAKISSDSSGIDVLVIPTNEEAVIAAAAKHLALKANLPV